MISIVRWFDDTKGYGIIEGFYENDIFVTYKDILDENYKTLFKNQLVEFKLLKTNKGLRAVKVIPR